MTTGASNDFERATEIARRMVTQWGMSDELGPMVYGENEGEVFLGRSITTHKNVSEVTLQKVDAEIRRIVDEQYKLARRLLEENRDKVEAWPRSARMGDAGCEQLNDIMAAAAARRRPFAEHPAERPTDGAQCARRAPASAETGRLIGVCLRRFSCRSIAAAMAW